MITVEAPQYRHYALISDFLDIAHLCIQGIKDRPGGLKLQNLALATMTGLALSSLPRNLTADARYANDECKSLGSGKQLILHGNPSALAKDVSQHVAVLGRHFLPKMHFQCCVVLQGTLGGNFDMFAASCESTAGVLLLTTRSRPTGVRVCPVAHVIFQCCI